MATNQKFLFENDFAHPEEMRKRAAVHTDDDLAQARAQGIADGRAEMEAEQHAADEHEIAALLTQLGETVETLCAQRTAEIDDAASQAGELALTICRKILPTLSAQNAMTEIEGLIMRTINEMQDEPRLVVRVADARVEELQARFERMAGAFQGSLVLLGDDELGDTDCSLLWADGGADRKLDRLWSEMNMAVAAISDARTQPVSTMPLDELDSLTEHSVKQTNDLPGADISVSPQPITEFEKDTANQESGHG
tara:strand:+ start:16188 stop:16946 length:759 start_codon:yes stop_codon:yes gene_type:complete